jgi:hypothetical protein
MALRRPRAPLARILFPEGMMPRRRAVAYADGLNLLEAAGG